MMPRATKGRFDARQRRGPKFTTKGVHTVARPALVAGGHAGGYCTGSRRDWILGCGNQPRQRRKGCCVRTGNGDCRLHVRVQCVRLTIEGMRERGFWRIVQIASINGHGAEPGLVETA